ncbi:hypothetical protein L914_10659 [Phytophthora nicotianae]|uniref:Uncharacterized protein n=2 Tax=Phytophthora nicotianae TaxID=4792 RepID=V9F1G6_PHYNI|nr:hypothetical protein F443_11097 [Phytophthora nicotianae P1569]ETM44075.1 hypothetical protein L914_10659 [Phytophthora nicotianae]
MAFSVEEGYAVLKEKLRLLVKDDSAVNWPDGAGIYIKATVNARQSDYQRLPENAGEFSRLLRKVWGRRKSPSQRLALFIENREAPGPASLEYWATVQARQSDGAPVIQPNNETFRQLNYIDARARQHQQEVAAASSAANTETRRIHIMINGVSVPIDLNIREVWAALGLPGYDLRPPYRERVVRAVAVPEDTADIEDTANDFDDDIEDGGGDNDRSEAVV